MEPRVSKLTDEQLNNFNGLHKQMIPERKKRFQTKDIYNKGKNIRRPEVNTLASNISEYAFQILRENGVTNFDENKWFIDFHHFDLQLLIK